MDEISEQKIADLNSNVEMVEVVKLVPVERAALGRLACLGDLYDARTDRFTGCSIFRDFKDLPDECVKSREDPTEMPQHICGESFKEKFNKLKLEPQLQLSLLAGSVELDRFGEFVMKTLSSKRILSLTLHYEKGTILDELTEDFEVLKPYIDLDAFSHPDSTHLVMGLKWGFNVFITATKSELNETDDETSVGAYLKSKLPVSKEIEIKGENGNEVTPNGTKQKFDFKYSTMSDVELDLEIASSKDIRAFFKNPPSGRGVPIKYILIPLSQMRKVFELPPEVVDHPNLVDIEPEVIDTTVHFWDELHSVKQDLNDVIDDLQNAKLDPFQATRFKEEFEKRMSEFQASIRENMIAIRSGNGTSGELLDAQEIFSSGNYSLVKTRQFIQLSDIQLMKNLNFMPEYNILLLGETGSGKSTTINAIANYLKYATFEEATANEFVQLIPASFALPDPKTGRPYRIETGTDDNENHAVGHSSTRSPLGYCFVSGDRVIRIIDTPGIGDTGGINTDKENFDKILQYLHHHKQLHGIIIVVKSTETRKTIHFRYCINELLTHLHKSACRNLVFLFTFSKNTLFGPGEGFLTLSDYLQNELAGVELELISGTNCFFVDNEAFRFLAAKKQGYLFTDKQIKSYEDSWVESVQQTTVMMEHIFDLNPHNLENTSSLNNARKLILELAEPMVRLKMNIDSNIEHIKKEQEKLRNSKQTKQTLALNLHLEVEDLEVCPLEYPTTVCAAVKCIEVVNYQDIVKINYKQRCHENCRIPDAEIGHIGDSRLRFCLAMDGGRSEDCLECGCAWQLHQHLTCTYEKVKRTVIDSNVEREIKSTEEAIKFIEEGLEQMEILVKEYQEDLKIIYDICSKFAYILIHNSNTPYNRYIEPYLDSLIDEEQKKMNAVANYPRTVYDSLVEMKALHQSMVQVLTEAIRNKSQEDVKIEDIHKYRDQLLNLKHSGTQLKQILDIFSQTRTQTLQFLDRPALLSQAGDSGGRKSFFKTFKSLKKAVKKLNPFKFK